MQNPSAKCMQMCPVGESIQRKKNRLLHILETNPSDTDADEGSKVGSGRIIKSYSRSAAGQILTNPEVLRPFPVLLQTVEHLLANVIEDDRVPPVARYDFINDRLRCVKQDGVIQRLSFEHWFRILPSIIRFYAFSAYWHCEERTENFDQKLNKDRLTDCLSLYIANYDSAEEFACTNAEMEALNLLVNNESFETINRCVLLNMKQPVFRDTLRLIFDWQCRKYVSVVRSLMKLPLPLACLFTAIHLNTVRKQTLQIMSHAYSCRNVDYPIDRLKTVLAFNSRREVIDECVFYEIPVFPENNTIQFTKMALKKEIAASKRLNELDQKLNKQPIPSLLLG